MKDKGLVTIKIYNVAGQRIRTLTDGVQDAGLHTATWDGKNSLGADVGSGIYFYKMETKGQRDKENGASPVIMFEARPERTHFRFPPGPAQPAGPFSIRNGH